MSVAGSELLFFLSLVCWIGALGGKKMDWSSRSFSRSLCVAVRFGLSLRSFSHSLSVLRDPEMN